jgi:phosphatidylglycerophosphatase A
LLPVLAALRSRSASLYAVAVVAAVVAAVWAAGRAQAILGARDPGRIVVDEAAGMVVAGAFVPGTWPAVGLVFALFRLFDVVKPFPAGVIDRRVHGGLGIVGDDLVAGAYAGLAARLVLELLG